MRFNKTLIILFLIFYSVHMKSQQNMLIIGDSHGALKDGWVFHLMQLRPGDKFINLSISGNTIGFNNLGKDTLNTLVNISSYIQKGQIKVGKIDKILILLGTNDCKNVFKDSFLLSVSRFESIIQIIHNRFSESASPEIIYITPPPFDVDSKLSEKYKGGNERLKILIPELMNVAKREKIKTINLNKMLGNDVVNYITDGVHYNNDGYKLFARIINRNL